MNDSARPISAPKIQASLDRLRASIGRVIKGKDDVIDRVLATLVAGGHLLIEDLPGLGKTTLAYCLARSLDVGFARIQFTSDLLPGDVLGVSVYDDSLREFVFKRGPVFTNILLADEINRTTPKTQSALLEVMDRGKVTIDGQTHAVPAPFMVFATQNPVDFEGTFPLPESQLDRFLMRVTMGYPAFDKELEILSQPYLKYDAIQADPVLSRAELLEIQHAVPLVHVEESVLTYLLKIVTGTRAEVEFRAGASTRGAQALKLAAQATALLDGRGFVVPEDITRTVLPVLTHRLGLRRQTSDTLEERRLVEGLLRQIVEAVPVPV